MRSIRNEVNLRMADDFGTIAAFCEELKTSHPDTPASYLYCDIFCRGMMYYRAERKMEAEKAQKKESENGK